MQQQKGFTLIELLVVIAIVAVLSVVVILTLNPAELLKQSRDSNRISDMATLKSALSIYLADVSTPALGTATNCYMSIAATTSQCGVFTNTYITGAVGTTTRAVDGTGWLPVNFKSISSGAPIGNLPVDPINNGTYYYAFNGSSTLVFEIDVKAMESSKYKNGGSNDVVSNDGGDQPNVYETGTAPGLAL